MTQPTEPGNVNAISVKPSIDESKAGFEIDNRPRTENGRESVLTLPTAPKTPSTEGSSMDYFLVFEKS